MEKKKGAASTLTTNVIEHGWDAQRACEYIMGEVRSELGSVAGVVISTAACLVRKRHQADAMNILRIMLPICGNNDGIRHYLAHLLYENYQDDEALALLNGPTNEPGSPRKFFLLRIKILAEQRRWQRIVQECQGFYPQECEFSLLVPIVLSMLKEHRFGKIIILLETCTPRMRKKMYDIMFPTPNHRAMAERYFTRRDRIREQLKAAAVIPPTGAGSSGNPLLDGTDLQGDRTPVDAFERFGHLVLPDEQH